MAQHHRAASVQKQAGLHECGATASSRLMIVLCAEKESSPGCMCLVCLVWLQGIEGHGFYGNCIVPIIENTARECELTDRLRQAIKDYPRANAVLVRRHGE